MVLEEPKQIVLVCKVSTQMKSNALCIVVFQSIIKPLVVAEVESPLLQLPLQVPVGLSDKAKARMRSLDRGNYIVPIFGWRPLRRSALPGAFEDLVQHKHGHVAADAVTLRRNAQESLNRRSPELGLKCIQLQDIGPCREVRVSPACVNGPSYLQVGCRVDSGILSSPANEILGVLCDPRVVWRYVVRHKIQEQLHAALRQLSPSIRETFWATQLCVNHIASYAIGRSDIIFWSEVGQCSPELVNQMCVLIGNCNAHGTSFPDPHQPDRIETELGESVPLL